MKNEVSYLADSPTPASAGRKTLGLAI